MKKLYSNMIIFAIFIILLSSNNQIQQCSASWYGDDPKFYFDMADNTVITSNTISITWQWFRDYSPYNEWGNGTVNRLDVFITTSYVTTPKIVYSLPAPINIWEIEPNITLYLPDFIEPIQQQGILFLFNFSSSAGYSKAFLKIIWNPVIPSKIRIVIPDYYYYIFIGIAGATIVLWVYWNTYSCRNLENLGKAQCSVKREELKRRVETYKKQTIEKEEIKEKLFET